ncbi:GyrI-like domain-containing protein [Intrasporangium flavum]|uniref:GyrI-like domain-containing protein n=1 Tax=Intrasporangium flavum TaxID=1428657 RepID=UPI001A958534|nr:GyrI-like domain-containing protein [Intrasporangium flavum]
MAGIEYVVKSLPPVRLVQTTGRVAHLSELGPTIGPAFQRLTGGLARAGVHVGPESLAWYDGDADGTTWGVGYPTSLETVDVEGAEVGDLPACERALTVVHRGSMATIGDAWRGLGEAVAARGLTGYGPCREVYLETPMDDPEAWVTELQQPVS